MIDFCHGWARCLSKGISGGPGGYITRVCMLLVIPAWPQAAAVSEQFEIAPALLECRKLDNSELRLACYDGLAQLARAAADKHTTTPGARFLAAKLRTTMEGSDYQLTMQAFMDLVNVAKFDETEKIKIHGWSRHEASYFLHLAMREPITLEFFHYDDGAENLSILLPVVSGSQIYDPEQFVFIIASMAVRL